MVSPEGAPLHQAPVRLCEAVRSIVVSAVACRPQCNCCSCTHNASSVDCGSSRSSLSSPGLSSVSGGNTPKSLTIAPTYADCRVHYTHIVHSNVCFPKSMPAQHLAPHDRSKSELKAPSVVTGSYPSKASISGSQTPSDTECTLIPLLSIIEPTKLRTNRSDQKN